ncbi:MAG: hypothetical protein IGS03_05850 [Candidatus Sericytochromatia bacterium]|nr:hypothetical protein [Candidatus Sericytochromatia bacterium]
MNKKAVSKQPATETVSTGHGRPWRKLLTLLLALLLGWWLWPLLMPAAEACAHAAAGV